MPLQTQQVNLPVSESVVILQSAKQAMDNQAIIQVADDSILQTSFGTVCIKQKPSQQLQPQEILQPIVDRIKSQLLEDLAAKNRSCPSEYLLTLGYLTELKSAFALMPNWNRVAWIVCYNLPVVGWLMAGTNYMMSRLDKSKFLPDALWPNLERPSCATLVELRDFCQTNNYKLSFEIQDLYQNSAISFLEHIELDRNLVLRARIRLA